MATTTMHFGPEWMRAKPQTPARQHPPPSPPPQASQQLGAFTYSALVAPVTHEPDQRDDSRPFRYSKDEMLRIYKEGGGQGGLNLEVERWDGIVRDVGSEPTGLREMSDTEKKLFAGPLNSELRRRQSTDIINTLSSPPDRQRLGPPNSTAGNTMRYGPFLARRRDSTDQPPLSLPRKLSLSNTQGGSLTSPRDALPSPRNRMGVFASGFDGVLNNGDSWSRKRSSAGVSGTSGGILAREGREEDARRSDIKEEEESMEHHSTDTPDSDPAAVVDQSSYPGPDVPPSDATQDSRVSASELDLVGQNVASMSLETRNRPNSNPRVLSSTNSLASGPPPGLTDPANIEWSYLDPQGQVQGPFRADLMQKWFDEGYFSPDLLMKRALIDADWIAVGTLERRAAGGRIFLSQISNGPPGLAIHAESPKSYSPVHEQNILNGYQPVPTRSLRSTLDSHLNGISPTESPSSSLGGGRFESGSPDPCGYGSRAGSNLYSSDPSFGVRAFGGRETTFQDPITDARDLNNNSLGRASTIDTFNTYNGGADSFPWSTGSGQINQGFDDNEQHHPYPDGFNAIGSGVIGNPLPVNHIHNPKQEHFGDTTYSGMGVLSSHHDSPVARQPSDINGMSFHGNLMNDVASQFGVPTSFSQSPSLPYTAPQHHQSISTFGDLLPQTSEAGSVTQTPTSAVQQNNASPWTARTRAPEPPAAPSPIVPPARPQAPEWTTPQSTIDPSPWLVASLPVVDDTWREIPGPNSLTFSNLGQHNKLQEQEEGGADDGAISPLEDVVLPPPIAEPTQVELANAVQASVTTTPSQSATPTAASAPTTGTQGPTPQKARRKSAVRDVQVATSKIALPSTPTVIRDQSSASALPATQPKPIWAVEDDSKKQKATGATMSLREIQEAEVRKAEARKAADKERERLARVNTASSNSAVEESQPFTSSWGLPTSQAGARNPISPKEASAINSALGIPSAPVWSNATSAPTAKKTMREIQEEEERRKKLAVKESMASAAARRGYAGTAVKAVPSAQATGGPWTTVGPNGKPTPPATNTPRPVANPSNSSTPTTTLRSNSTTTRQAVTTSVKVATPRIEDSPITPSHDFLKWLGESLKGLNSSVNLEEITSMLLSFPLEPDQSTIEIVSDLIYANSTTLDGRRFALEYVNRRKADATTQRGTAGASGSSTKPVSIADVVKTQPKPMQQEWGFKVVNKKKKGGRS